MQTKFRNRPHPPHATPPEQPVGRRPESRSGVDRVPTGTNRRATPAKVPCETARGTSGRTSWPAPAYPVGRSQTPQGTRPPRRSAYCWAHRRRRPPPDQSLDANWIPSMGLLVSSAIKLMQQTHKARVIVQTATANQMVLKHVPREAFSLLVVAKIFNLWRL